MQDNFDVEETVRALRADLDDRLAEASVVWSRQKEAQRVRDCEWEGQSVDGRKHADEIGEEARPFEGASDVRVPLVDGVINELVALAKTGFFRSMVQARPVEPTDAARAQNVTTLLRWLRDQEMREELETEVELLAQYLFGDDPGAAVLAVDWLQDTQLMPREVTWEDLAGMYASGAAQPDSVDWSGEVGMEPELMADFTDLMVNPLRADEALAWLWSAFPSVQPSKLKAALRELRADGRTVLAVPEVRSNRPSITALRLCEEVFFPLGTADLQRARAVHRREWLSEVELRERVATAGWDKAWVEAVLERGKGDTVLSGGLSTREIVEEKDELYEVWWSYERRADELGVAGIYHVVWSGVVGDMVGWSGLSSYRHGKYPFVLARREIRGRSVRESRGMSVPIATHQNEIKTQRDARANYIQLTATPPKKRRVTTGLAQVLLAPDATIPMQKMDDFDLVRMPQFMGESVEMERTVRSEADEYSGRMTSNANADRTAILQQQGVNAVFSAMRSAMRMVLELCAQFYTPADLERVMGVGGAQLTGDGIDGRFDVTIEIDARDLNFEFAQKKLESYIKLLGLDANGEMNRSGLLEWSAYALDPVLARAVLRPAASASRQAISDEQGVLAKMALGIETPMAEGGVDAPQLRLQTLTQALTQSPRLVQAYQSDPLFQRLLENRQKYLTQQVVQEQNKVIGRLGTTPVQEQGA